MSNSGKTDTLTTVNTIVVDNLVYEIEDSAARELIEQVNGSLVDINSDIEKTAENISKEEKRAVDAEEELLKRTQGISDNNNSWEDLAVSLGNFHTIDDFLDKLNTLHSKNNSTGKVNCGIFIARIDAAKIIVINECVSWVKDQWIQTVIGCFSLQEESLFFNYIKSGIFYRNHLEVDGSGFWSGWKIGNDTEIKSIIDSEISKLVDFAPEDLNTFKEIAEWIEDEDSGAAAMANQIALLQSQVAALSSGLKLTASVNPSSIYKNTPTSITAKATLSNNTVAENIIINIGNEKKEGSNVSTLSFTTNVNLASNLTITASAICKGMNLNASTSVATYYPTYVGIGKTVEDVYNDSHKKLLSSSRGIYSFEIEEDGQYFFLIVPNSSVTKPSNSEAFKMGGTPFSMDLNVEQSISGYTIHKSSNAYGEGTVLNIEVF